MRHKQVGVFIVHIIRSVIYGSTFLFTGFLLDNVSVFDVLALRFLISAVVMTLLAWIGVIHLSFDKEKLKALLPVAIFEPVAYFLLETFGLTGVTTSLAGIMGAISPVAIIALETLILKEKTTVLQKVFLSMGILGVMLIGVLSADGSGENTVWGILLMIGSHISGSLFVIFSRKGSKRCTAMETTYFCAVVGAVVFNLINVFRHLSLGTITSYFAPLLNWNNLIGFFFLSVMSTIVATIFQNYALSKVQASSLSALGGISTVTSVLLGVLINHEILYWYHILGGCLILAGALGVNYFATKKLPKPSNS